MKSGRTKPTCQDNDIKLMVVLHEVSEVMHNDDIQKSRLLPHGNDYIYPDRVERGCG